MLKKYIIDGREWQYEEGKQPAGAVELDTVKKKAEEKPPGKARPAPNKARRGVATK